ncbi:MAG: oxaloacetate decarboxylase [Salinirussus sp.]
MDLGSLIDRDELLMAIGAWDALTARMAEDAGAEAVYMSGSCVSSSVHGGPDVGLTTMSEMLDRARAIDAAIDVPLIADGDTGYGNPLNVRRTVREYERAGVNAIQLEDQDFPKKCGHFEGKRLISAPEFATKVAAAVDARESDDFLIIARTDAIAVDGLDEAIQRARLYREAGADVSFIEAPTEREQMQKVTEAVSGPHLANLAAKGKTPPLSAEDLRDVGYDLAIYPSDAFKAALRTIQDVYETLIEERSQESILEEMVEWEERDEITGLPEISTLEDRYERREREFERLYEEMASKTRAD